MALPWFASQLETELGVVKDPAKGAENHMWVLTKQQSAGEIIFSLPNGLQAYYFATVTFNQIRTLITGTCGGTMCHTGHQQPTLANDGNLHATLLGTAVSECGSARLVVPGNPEGSAIIQLVNRQCTKGGMPFCMPHDCTSNPCLPASQIRTITNWIQAGAPGP